ncbi:MAG: PAS domain-containing protein [Deltaproteobacteria bacterium]
MAYTGVPESQQLGFGWLERLHDKDRDRVREEWRTTVKSGTRFSAELRLQSASGEYRWFRSRAIPIRDAAGEIVKWYGANTDIDDSRRAEPAFSAPAQAE